MTGFDTLKLISKTYETDELGQSIPSEAEREVYCRVTSATQSEFFEAGRLGFKPEYRATLATSYDYNGEDLCEYDGKRYAIYRTYKTDTDALELYLRRETGEVK